MSRTKRQKKIRITEYITIPLFAGGVMYLFRNDKDAVPYIGASVVMAVYIGILLMFIILAIHKRKRLAGASMKSIDKMSGTDFEQYLCSLYKKMGYKVSLTPGTMDFGADLILEKDGLKTAVQAKRYRRDVGEAAVQQIIAGKGYYHCDRAAVVTNSHYTDAARKLAKETGVILIDRSRLGKDF